MTNTGLVDGTFDPSYRALQNCEASSGTAFDVLVEIGISQSVVVNGAQVQGISAGICPDEIVWYNDEEHFKTLTALTGTLEVSRETVEDGDSNFTVTNSGLITWTKDIGIKFEHDSEYLAAIRNIIMSDSINGYEGALIQAYSNGGFHMRVTLTNAAEGYALKEVILNAKTANFVDLFAEIDDEAEFTQSFNVEASPLYELQGNVSKALGLPFDATITSTESISGTDITVSAEVTSEYDTITKKVFYQVIDTGKADYALAAGIMETGAETVITLAEAPVGEVKVQYMFTFEQAQLLIPGKTVTLAPEGTIISTIELTEGTVADTTADINWTAVWGTDGKSFELTLGESSDGLTIDGTTVGTQTVAEADGTSGTINLTALTAETQYVALADGEFKLAFTTTAAAAVRSTRKKSTK